MINVDSIKKYFNCSVSEHISELEDEGEDTSYFDNYYSIVDVREDPTTITVIFDQPISKGEDVETLLTYVFGDDYLDPFGTGYKVVGNEIIVDKDVLDL